MIGIMGALEEEVELYLSELNETKKTKLTGFLFFSGKLSGKDVVVVKSGAGKVNASICAQILILNFKVSSIIFTGVAGALNPDLEIKDIVISKDSVQHDINAEELGFKKGQIPFSDLMVFNASDEMRKIAFSAADSFDLKVIEGRILTGDQFITDKKLSGSLRKEFKGDCVDMESAAVAHVCALNNVPHLIIRSISDKADHSASVDFNEFSKEASKNSFLLVKKLISSLKETKADTFDIKSKIRAVPDWPKKGIMFRDITTLLKDKGGFNQMIDLLVERYKGMEIDAVVGIEARGFITGAVLANRLGLGFVLIRKKGKLPAETVYEEYDLEYGKDKIEIHKDAIEKGDKVLIVDDLIATGGTALAACNLVKKLNGKIVEVSFIINLPDLNGKKKLEKAGFKTFSLVDFEGE
tara:strand:+ start:3827 stop:5059 length:1233 start_codon:yes stop_codon:yes gene_type:complete